MKNLPYRDGVGIILLNKKKEVFVGKRIDTQSEAWQMPQGGIDDGEDALSAAMREMKEEVGTNNARLLAGGEKWYCYDLPEELIPKIWNGRFRGQKQEWFCFEFLGSDKEINIETGHPEFCRWKWVLPSHLPNIIVPFKQDLYRELINDFAGCFRG